MFDPMLARLGGCCVFAALFGAMLIAVAAPRDTARRDVVAAAEVQHRAVTSLFARP